MSFEVDGIKQIEEEELKNLLAENKDEWLFIDVRELDEYEEGHISNVPLIPMQTIPQMVEQFDKDKSYLFICRSGGRSQTVAQYMKGLGFNKVHNFAGGMLSWSGEMKEGPEWVVKDAKELK